ncbi:hypothetical protein [Methylosarcina fibrata]|uniref:hypothetical protein n=1 Tax=Methylosarcina fibrata TaxID=105972 RepID=UPI0003631A46|nr:hypothetical protein [Methylosarcina fibrata]
MERLLSGKNNYYPPATSGTVAARGIGFPDEAHGVDETAVPEEFFKDYIHRKLSSRSGREWKGKPFFGLFNPQQPVFLMRLKLVRVIKISNNYFLSMTCLNWHQFCVLPFMRYESLHKLF